VEAAPAADPVALSQEWCGEFVPADKAKSFAYPELVSGGEDGAAKGTPRWVNVWATWCKPCVEELPRIAEFHAQLKGGGQSVAIDLVASDEAEAVEKFVSEHAAAKGTKVMADPSLLTQWLVSLGIEDGALPVHLFVDGDDRVRCVRSGGVGEDDFEAVQAVFRSM
jgi:thiol-disulfide isomerase/thioredoxin